MLELIISHLVIATLPVPDIYADVSNRSVKISACSIDRQCEAFEQRLAALKVCQSLPGGGYPNLQSYQVRQTAKKERMLAFGDSLEVYQVKNNLYIANVAVSYTHLTLPTN